MTDRNRGGQTVRQTHDDSIYCTSISSRLKPEESKEFLDNVSELSSAPVIMQTHDCCQRYTDEEESKAVSTYHKQTCTEPRGRKISSI